jgi:hypothetical protein
MLLMSKASKAKVDSAEAMEADSAWFVDHDAVARRPWLPNLGWCEDPRLITDMLRSTL